MLKSEGNLTFEIYPNPSPDGYFTIRTGSNPQEILLNPEVFDMPGRPQRVEFNGTNRLYAPVRGIFVVRISFR